jgi:hypothetical protein
MSSKTLKQLAILGALGAALVVVLMFQGGEPTPAGTAARPSNRVSGTTGTRQKPGADQVAVTVTDIQLEALNAPRDDAPTPERNLFRFEVKAPPPQPPRAPGPAGAPPSIAQPVPPKVPVPSGPPPPPPIPLRFIGVLNAPTQAGRVAVLTDGRGANLMGREGDIIEGRYRLLRIGPDAVEMAYTDGRGRQVIRLSGQ